MFRLLTALIFSCFYGLSYSQSLETPVEYMQYLTSREQELSKKYLSYMSEVAHGNRARKMEKKRQELVTEIRKSLNDASQLRPYKGDATLRDAFRNYWDILLKVFNEDYDKIVNMEEISEQSYDNMEAYLLAQEKAGDILQRESEKIGPIYNTFAAKNNVRLIDEGESKMEKKLHQVGLVNEYYHKMFLIFFKSFKQEMYLMEALNRKDINALEQNRITLLKFAEEGLASLDTIKGFKGDGSLLNANRKVLEFYKAEAEKHIPELNEYLIKNDEFEKIKKAFDAKPAGKRTQADIDLYNKWINELNAAIASSNKTLNIINANRQKVVDNWENTKKDFMEAHVPKGK